MKLSIIIVSYNTEQALRECLASIFEHVHVGAFQVIVVDNASSDGSVAMVREQFPRATLVTCETNRGFASACNLGLAQARGEFVLFLNSDTVVTEGGLDMLVRTLEDHPDVGVVGPRILNEDGSVQQSFGDHMSFTSEFLQKCVNAGYRQGRGPLRSYVQNKTSEESYPDWVSGACLLTRRAILEEVGAFDERFFMYAEDVDLCTRIREAGYRVLFTPDAEITHRRGLSAATNSERVYLESHLSRLYFYEKHYGRAKVGLLKLYMMLILAFGYVWNTERRPAYRNVLREVWAF